MKKTLYLISFLVIFSLGCSSLAAIPVTQTTVPSETSLPTLTTAPQTFTPTEEAPTRLVVFPGAFSVEVNIFLLTEVDDQVMMISDEDKGFYIMLTADFDKKDEALDVAIHDYVGALERKGMAISLDAFSDFKLNGADGLRTNYSGMGGDIPIAGSTAAINSGKGFTLVAFGVSRLREDKDAWEKKGLPNFNQIVSSLQFIDSTASCDVSTDPTYGYTPQNPIKVGGSVPLEFGLEGVARENAYLDNLLDGNGGPVNYERQGSTYEGETILDMYSVSNSQGGVTLYVDIYNYIPPLAPAGFTCSGPIPFSPP